MPVICETPDDLFREVQFESEKEFERAVVELSDAIFGSLSIYVDVKKRVKGNNIISIPDGYLIDMTDQENPQLFVIENELSSHDPLRHIGVQMLRFVTSFEDAHVDVRNFLMDEISKVPQHLSRLEEGCKNSSKRNIDNYLDSAVFGPFRGLVIIDKAQPELHNVLHRINANISVLELKAYKSESGKTLYEFDTLYDEFEDDLSTVTQEEGATRSTKATRRQRRARADTIIVPAKKDGFEQVFLGENQWYAIRIGAAMKDRIKYIAAYQIRPISGVTHIAPVKEILPYQDSGKYIVIF